jgi:hypothetical protein
MNPNEFPIVFLRCIDEALLGDTPGAEGCHKGVVLTPQDHYVRVRLVKVVVELRKEALWRSGFYGLLTP